MKRQIVLTIAFIFLMASPAYGVVPTQKFKNCSAVNKVYQGGVAKNKKVTNKNSTGVPQKSKYAPFVNKKIYNSNKRLDRDKDGIACER